MVDENEFETRKFWIVSILSRLIMLLAKASDLYEPGYAC